MRRCDKTRFLITSCCNHFLLPPTVAGDKCTVEVFKQFLHWVAMQQLSDETSGCMDEGMLNTVFPMLGLAFQLIPPSIRDDEVSFCC